jgi:hypothetical protein
MDGRTDGRTVTNSVLSARPPAIASVAQRRVTSVSSLRVASFVLSHCYLLVVAIHGTWDLGPGTLANDTIYRLPIYPLHR